MKPIASLLLLALCATGRCTESALDSLHFPVGEEVRYSETTTNAMLARPVVQQGMLRIDTDGSLIMEVQEPFRELRRLTANRLYLERERNGKARQRQARLREDKPAHLALIATVALLTGNLERLRQHFAISEAVADDGWRVTLTPRAEPVRGKLTRIELAGDGPKLLLITTYHTDQRHTELRILP